MLKGKKSVVDEMLAGLTEFAEALESGEDLGKKFTCHKLALDLRPQQYTPEMVRETRKLLSVSQPLFARFLGVSTPTVRHWEQGLANPQPIACRFMDEIRRDPKYYLDRLLAAAKPKALTKV
jgi:putative transcriptional regulator